ncbi:MAG: aspartate carbamoyltransferase [Phycisphaerales bacterium]
MDFTGSHILSVDQFERGDLYPIIEVARRMEPFARGRRVTRVLEGAVLANLFFEPSTRTRISFGVAFNRLGGAVRDTTGVQDSSLTKGESILDMSRVVSGYADVIVIRHPKKGAVSEFAEATNVPVLNGGDGPGEHPTQALLDLYTIHKETGRSLKELDGLKIAMVGDLKYGRTVHSLTKLLALFRRVEFTFVSHPDLGMPDTVIERARERGHTVRVTDNLDAGIADAEVIYSTRTQQERFKNSEDSDQYRGRYSLTRERFERSARTGAVIMHPLPRDSRPEANELDADLNALPNLAVFRQAENGVPVRMALFALVLGVVDEIEKESREAPWFRPKKISDLDP